MSQPHAEWSEFLPAYDLPTYAGTSRAYLIATTQRTGSHFLAHLLAADGSLGVPFEYLNSHRMWLELEARRWPHDELSEVRLLEEMIARRTGSSGWFGLKAHWHTWAAAQSRPDISKLVVPERVIYLSRGDALAQGVSLAIAEQTGVWVNSGDVRHTSPAYDAVLIEDALRRVEAEKDAWETFIRSWPGDVLRVTYEELVGAPGDVVGRIFDYFAVQPAEQLRDLPPLSPSPDLYLREWAERYTSERQANCDDGATRVS